MSNRTRTAIVVAGGSLVLAACTSSSTKAGPAPAAAHKATHNVGASAPAAATSNQPCALLSQSDAETAVGQTLRPGKQVATLDDCQWTTSDFAAGVDITVSDWNAMVVAAHGNGATPTSISGVGDEALNLNGSNGSLLYVRKGNAGFLLTINGPHVDSLPDHGLAKEKVLAAAVLTHTLG